MKEFIKKVLNRFKSRMVWVSLGSFILWILKTSGNLEGLGLSADSFNTGWNLIVGFLVSAGIINNPSDREEF